MGRRTWGGGECVGTACVCVWVGGGEIAAWELAGERESGGGGGGWGMEERKITAVGGGGGGGGGGRERGDTL